MCDSSKHDKKAKENNDPPEGPLDSFINSKHQTNNSRSCSGTTSYNTAVADRRESYWDIRPLNATYPTTDMQMTFQRKMPCAPWDAHYISQPTPSIAPSAVVQNVNSQPQYTCTETVDKYNNTITITKSPIIQKEPSQNDQANPPANINQPSTCTAKNTDNPQIHDVDVIASQLAKSVVSMSGCTNKTCNTSKTHTVRGVCNNKSNLSHQNNLSQPCVPSQSSAKLVCTPMSKIAAVKNKPRVIAATPCSESMAPKITDIQERTRIATIECLQTLEDKVTNLQSTSVSSVQSLEAKIEAKISDLAKQVEQNSKGQRFSSELKKMSSDCDNKVNALQERTANFAENINEAFEAHRRDMETNSKMLSDFETRQKTMNESLQNQISELHKTSAHSTTQMARDNKQIKSLESSIQILSEDTGKRFSKVDSELSKVQSKHTLLERESAVRINNLISTTSELKTKYNEIDKKCGKMAMANPMFKK